MTPSKAEVQLEIKIVGINKINKRKEITNLLWSKNFSKKGQIKTKIVRRFTKPLYFGISKPIMVDSSAVGTPNPKVFCIENKNTRNVEKEIPIKQKLIVNFRAVKFFLKNWNNKYEMNMKINKYISTNNDLKVAIENKVLMEKNEKKINNIGKTLFDKAFRILNLIKFLFSNIIKRIPKPSVAPNAIGVCNLIGKLVPINRQLNFVKLLII